jgi:hypothetical protein
MPHTPISESFLTLLAGRQRAAAIMGDLTELSATRGRLWFWTAYARTLFRLSWRIVLALFVAEITREFIFNLAAIFFHLTPPSWRTTHGASLLNSSGPLLACIVSTLWFVLPFAAVRYGLRDRFVQLTFALALGATVTFLFIPWASLCVGGGTLLLAATAFVSQRWRSPLLVLAGTASAGLLTWASVAVIRCLVFHPYGPRSILYRYAPMADLQITLLVIAIVGSHLHRLLFELPEPQQLPPA